MLLDFLLSESRRPARSNAAMLDADHGNDGVLQEDEVTKSKVELFGREHARRTACKPLIREAGIRSTFRTPPWLTMAAIDD